MAARSVVGATAMRASLENTTRPTRNASGSWSTKSDAAFCAAANRDGSTSVACIDPETSSVRTIVACSRGTATIIDGRARAMTRAAIAATYSTGGT